MGNRRLSPLLIAVLVLVVVGAGLPKLIKSRQVQICGGLTRRVETAQRRIALTFDDGPTPGDTQTVLDILGRYRVRATFFLVGSQVAEDLADARAIVGAGHQIGNHSWSHRRLIAVTPHTVAREITDTDRVLRGVGYQGDIAFRPPYGNKLVVLPCYLAMHRRHTFTWDVAPETFDPATPQGAQEIAAAVIAETRPGSIILLHPMNGGRAAQAAIAPVIERLQGDGYTFVTLDELIRG